MGDVILPCSKVMDAPSDYLRLSDQLAVLGRYPDVLYGQHNCRKWEYAIALAAIQDWQDRTGQAYLASSPPHPAVGSIAPLTISDVGGAGSYFWQVLASCTDTPILVVDPVLPVPVPVESPGRRIFPGSLQAYVDLQPAPPCVDILTCISVIEHVAEVRPFLQAAHQLLKPGGLLVLTTDYWDAEGPDVAHFHWMRERIYNAESMRHLLQILRRVGFASFGAADWTYHGAQVYDYSVASLAVVKG